MQNAVLGSHMVRYIRQIDSIGMILILALV